jgi:catechol 2,3-dioxygenase-like lactoylglutathione lyase family enzyme
MAINVLELHHHAVRVPPAKAGEVARFYQDVLGLKPDSQRPDIPSVPGSWMYVGPQGGPTTQIHIMGSDGMPPFAKSKQQDPTRFHVALAVDDIQAAQRELDRIGTRYWIIGGVVGPNSVQIFLDDPVGNMIELHQIGTCNCNRLALGSAASVP